MKCGVLFRIIKSLAKSAFPRNKTPEIQPRLIRQLSYLLFENFKDRCYKTDKALEYLLEKYLLLDYIASNWTSYPRESREIVVGVALKFFRDMLRTSLSYQVMAIKSYRYCRYSQNPSKNVSGLHFCAYFGMDVMMTRMLETLLKADVESKRSRC
jgi:hypothetical protein